MDGGHEEDENDEDIDDLIQLPQSQPANSIITSKTVPTETKTLSLNGDFIFPHYYKYRINQFLSFRKFINFSSEEKVVEQKEQYFKDLESFQKDIGYTLQMQLLPQSLCRQ